jgi:hypothetical protein
MGLPHVGWLRGSPVVTSTESVGAVPDVPNGAYSISRRPALGPRNQCRNHASAYCPIFDRWEHCHGDLSSTIYASLGERSRPAEHVHRRSSCRQVTDPILESLAVNCRRPGSGPSSSLRRCLRQPRWTGLDPVLDSPTFWLKQRALRQPIELWSAGSRSGASDYRD